MFSRWKALLALAVSFSSLAADAIVVRVEDAVGKPVAGAYVAFLLEWTDPEFATMYLRMDFPEPGVTDADGTVVIDDDLGVALREALGDPIALIALDSDESRIAIAEVKLAEPEVTLRLEPGCRVHGIFKIGAPGDETAETSPGAPAATFGNVTVTWRGHRIVSYDATQMSEPPMHYTFRLPPGAYAFRFVVASTAKANATPIEKTIEVKSGQEDLSLDAVFALEAEEAASTPPSSDPSPARNAQTMPDDYSPLSVKVGEVAPELKEMAGWKNGDPIGLADLRGKIVLLDFWGYWCGPCIHSMPYLMALHEAFGQHGLAIVAIHDASLASVEELDQMLAPIKERAWGGRDLPFLVALDSGGPQQVAGTPVVVDGVNNAAYGIRAYPTTILLDREGKIVDFVEPTADSTWSRIEALLGVKVERPKFDLPTPAPRRTSQSEEGRDIPEWQGAFYRIYALEDGQALKYIYPPYLSARAGYFAATVPGEQGIVSPDVILLEWEQRSDAAWPPKAYARMRRAPLRFVLEHVVGMAPGTFEGPDELLDMDLMGDWVVRSGASIQERADSLVGLLRGQFGVPIRIVQREGGGWAIVKSGE